MGRDFPGVQWLRLRALTAWDTSLIPSQETKIPHASGQKNPNVNQKRYFNRFNKDFLKCSTSKSLFKKFHSSTSGHTGSVLVREQRPHVLRCQKKKKRMMGNMHEVPALGQALF